MWGKKLDIGVFHHGDFIDDKTISQDRKYTGRVGSGNNISSDIGCLRVCIIYMCMHVHICMEPY